MKKEGNSGLPKLLFTGKFFQGSKVCGTLRTKRKGGEASKSKKRKTSQGMGTPMSPPTSYKKDTPQVAYEEALASGQILEEEDSEGTTYTVSKQFSNVRVRTDVRSTHPGSIK